MYEGAPVGNSSDWSTGSVSGVGEAVVISGGTRSIWAWWEGSAQYANIGVLAETRSDSWCLVERSGFAVRRCQAAIIFSFVIGIASRKVCIGVLPKHQRP